MSMTNVKVIKKNQSFDFDPFNFKCNSCGKEKVYTDAEIDTKKKPYPDPQNYDYDFYITCPFCKKGVMEPPAFVSFHGAFEDLTEK